MILKRYGNSFHSVSTDFDSRAMTEIGFRRDRVSSIPVEEFEAGYERVEQRAMTAETAGEVQDEAEQALLSDLLAQVEAFASELNEGEYLVLDNDADDYPKTRDEKKPVIVDGQNQIHFVWRVDPPLRMSRFAPKS